MEQLELDEIWEQILNELKHTIVESAMNHWILPLAPLAIEEDTLTLATPSEFSKKYIEGRYIPFISDAAKTVTSKELKIKIVAIESSDEESSKEKESVTYPVMPEVHESKAETPSYEVKRSEGAQDTKEPEPTLNLPMKNQEKGTSYIEAVSPIAPGDRSTLNPKYTFETFVTGNSNKIARAASDAVAESPGNVYNPLFMYGGVGLSKTHLMHAIGNKILENDPNKRVLYISSEKFTNELINSISIGKTTSFRQKYRTIDVLLIDDIQFLQDKVSTQEEFFHTFNELYNAKKQIIISSDRNPRELSTLENRLQSRFEWGLITDIQAPDLETRIAILKKKASIEHLDVPQDVMYYIASRVDNNIRELEGVLTRVVAFASINNKPITTELTAEAMNGIYQTKRAKSITVELIQQIVASYFKLNVSDLLDKKRTKELAMARQIAMYLCRSLIDMSLPEIGKRFGGRDHTTVIHACEKIEKIREEDAKKDAIIKELIKNIERV
ncbi:MAG: chromosomal replication initiator protein DnaA [Selenomonadaceae bacterium]